MSIGFSPDEADRILIPDAIADRDHDPADGAVNGSGNPSGGVATQWAQGVNFRRPSSIRLFGHAAGVERLSQLLQGIPQYQAN